MVTAPASMVAAFQLTHLLRGATGTGWVSGKYGRFQLTHLLRGATRRKNRQRRNQKHFNSRTSCEVRHAEGASTTASNLFQLTHLLRGATNVGMLDVEVISISTHAPLARCDADPAGRCFVDLNISTHAPLARCDPAPSIGRRRMLISTHAPLARCDKTEMVDGQKQKISTHAPLARCDVQYSAHSGASRHFNSRTSCEVRLGGGTCSICRRDFNSRTSCEVRPGKRGRPRND